MQGIRKNHKIARSINSDNQNKAVEYPKENKVLST